MNELDILRALRNGDISRVQAYTMLRMKWDGHVDGVEYAEWATGYDPSERSVEGASDECCEAELCGEDGCESYGYTLNDGESRPDVVSLVILERWSNGTTVARMAMNCDPVETDRETVELRMGDGDGESRLVNTSVAIRSRARPYGDGVGGAMILRSLFDEGGGDASALFDSAWRKWGW